MADQQVFGVFKEEEGLFISHEPYDKPTVANPRYAGKQFSVPNTSAISGRGRDAWFDKNLQMATPSHSYMEALDLPTVVGGRAGPGAENPPGGGPPLHDKPFRPSNPAAKPGRAAGSLYGTFGPPSMFFAMPGDSSQGDGRPITAPDEKSLGNIYTNNPKRAGPGYPDQYRLLSGGTYTYVPDEYQRGRTLEKALKQEARARIPKPFWGGTRASGVFTSDSELYGTQPLKPPPRSRSASDGRPAWRPNNPPARGRFCGQFSPPMYIPCPEPKEKLQPFVQQLRASTAPRPFVPSNAGHKRLSMWSVNPYERVNAITPPGGRPQPVPAAAAAAAAAARAGAAAAAAAAAAAPA